MYLTFTSYFSIIFYDLIVNDLILSGYNANRIPEKRSRPPHIHVGPNSHSWTVRHPAGSGNRDSPPLPVLVLHLSSVPFQAGFRHRILELKSPQQLPFGMMISFSEKSASYNSFRLTLPMYVSRFAPQQELISSS